MSYSISTLLTRNLQEVFGENDPGLRRAAIDEFWTEDGVFYDPKTGVHRGRDEIDRVAGAIKATHPDFQYQPIAEPEELGNAGRVQWVSGRPGEAPAYTGTDFIIAREGRIAAFISFSISYPELDSAVRRAMRRISKVAQPACNRCVQATPDCALLFIVAQVVGAPDAGRWAKTKNNGKD